MIILERERERLQKHLKYIVANPPDFPQSLNLLPEASVATSKA